MSVDQYVIEREEVRARCMAERRIGAFRINGADVLNMLGRIIESKCDKLDMTQAFYRAAHYLPDKDCFYVTFWHPDAAPCPEGTQILLYNIHVTHFGKDAVVRGEGYDE